MTIDEMIVKKKELGYSYDLISQKSGVPVSTIQKIFAKTTTAPRHLTMEALGRVFEFRDNPEGYSYVCEDSGMTEKTGAFDSEHELRGAHNLYKSKKGRQKLHTINDYRALPEGARVELIDGVFYDMAAPTFVHSMISSSIWSAFMNYITDKNGQCIPAVAPVDVQLDCDDMTMVQPDVMVICDRNKIVKSGVIGAPDLIAEVLSPSNWRHDMIRKLVKYRKAGVREYWIVDPDDLSIIVYDFTKSEFPVMYSFKDEVPVGIWNDECKVDFKLIYDKISFISDK